MLETLEQIIKHGLMIRQIPERVQHIESIENHKDGNEIIEREIMPYNTYARCKEKLTGNSYRFNDATQKVYLRRTQYYTVPEYAGYWLVMKSPNSTGSTVKWELKTCELAPTLKESVSLWVAKNQPKEIPDSP